LKIRTIPISKIKPAKYNPRKDLQPGDAEYEKIKRSIEEFGLVDPLVWNEHNGVLVGGHQRLKVIKDMGWKEVQVSAVSIKDPKREKILNIALNRVQGDWEEEALGELIHSLSLSVTSEELALTGFSETELSQIIDEAASTLDDKLDEVPDRPKKPITKLGDVWRIGDHLLVCGDINNATHRSKLMGDAHADLVFTDPPYNVDYEGYTDKKLKIKNDKMDVEEFTEFLNQIFSSYRDVMKDGASLYVCHPSSFQREFQNAMEAAGFAIRCQIIWAKNTFAWGFGRYKFQHEPIFYASVKGQSDQWYGDKSQSTLWEEKKPAANSLHPTMKPVDLVVRAIKNSSKAGDLVVDLFGGSGTTMVAAETLKRKACLMELDPGYCDVIIERMKNNFQLVATKG